MPRQIEEISIEEYRAKYEQRQKRGRTTRPDIPSAPKQAPTGLTSLILRGWSVQSPDAIRYRLYIVGKVGFDTGLCETELLACNRAKELEKL